jgi:hypothetical protein
MLDVSNLWSVVRGLLYPWCWWHLYNLKSIFARVKFGGGLSRKATFVKKVINESFLNKFVVMCWFWVFMASFEDNFLEYYQSRKFQESEHDPFVSCSVKRKCLSQLYLASVTLWVSITAVLTYVCVSFVSNIVHITLLRSRMHGAVSPRFPYAFTLFTFTGLALRSKYCCVMRNVPRP